MYHFTSGLFQNNLTNDHFHGIFAHLQEESEQQYLDKAGIIGLAASPNKQNLDPTHIFTIESDMENGFWHSLTKTKEDPNWIQFDFKENKVLLLEYTINAYPWDFLKEMEVYSSDDNFSWTKIDNQPQEKQQSNEAEKITMTFKTETPKLTRFIKFVQRGERFNGDFVFVIHRIEFYGFFYTKDALKRLRTCFMKRDFHFSSLYFLFMLSK